MPTFCGDILYPAHRLLARGPPLSRTAGPSPSALIQAERLRWDGHSAQAIGRFAHLAYGAEDQSMMAPSVDSIVLYHKTRKVASGYSKIKGGPGSEARAWATASGKKRTRLEPKPI